MSSAARGRPARGATTRGRGFARDTTTNHGSQSNTRGIQGPFRGPSSNQNTWQPPKTTALSRSTFVSNQTARGKSVDAKAYHGSNDWQDRYNTLQASRTRERAHAIQNGLIADPDKPRTLAEAITPVGTCQDMCAEFERVERVVQKDVWKEETDPEYLDASPLDREPDEKRMVKKFRRAAAGIEEQLPSDLRPPHVLKRTCDYLFNDIVGQAETLASVHHFVWDRTRAIRNDFSIQQITKPEELSIAIECYERIARFHMLSLHQLALPTKPYDKYDWQQEREQLDRTLLSLMQYYEDSRGRVQLPNEAEFRAYSVIFQLQDPVPDLEDRVQSWPRHITLHPKVKHALKLYAAACTTNDMQGPLKPPATHAIAQQDWMKFWQLVGSQGTSYLMACVAEIYFNHVRKTVLQALLKSASTKSMTQWRIDEVRHMLAFDDEDEVEEFCERYGLAFTDINGQTLLDLSVLKYKQLPDAKATATKQSKSNLVEQKRWQRTFPAVINGLTVLEARQQGYIADGEDVDAMDDDDQSVVQDQSDDDSLFVKDDKPAPSISAPSISGKPSNTKSPFSLFNQPPTQPSKGSTFGQPSAQSSTGTTFGQPSAQSSTGTTFGQPSAPSGTSTNFGKPSAPSGTSSNFGKPSVSPFAQSAGSDNPPSLFAPPPKSSFGKPSTSPFAQSSAGEVTESIFAQPKPSSTTSMFAQPSATQPNEATTTFSKPTEAPTNNTTIFKSLSTPKDDISMSKPASFDLKQASVLTQSDVPKFNAIQLPPSEVPRKSVFDFAAKPKDKDDGAQQQATPSLFDRITKPSPFANGDAASTTPTMHNNTTTKGESPHTGLFSQLQSTSQSKSQLFAPSENAQPHATPSIPPSNLGTQLSTPSQQPVATSQNTLFSAVRQEASTSSKATQNAPSQTIPQAASKQNTISSAPNPEPAPKKPDLNAILDEAARHLTLDEDTGFLKQYVDFMLSQIVTTAQETVYFEHINQEATEYRTFKLSVRYGIYWRDLCRRRRLARRGRETRERAFRRMRESQSQQSAASSVIGSASVSSGRAAGNNANSKRDAVDKMFQQSLGSGRWSRLAAEQEKQRQAGHGSTGDQSDTVIPMTRIDRHGRIIKPNQAPSLSNNLRRSANASPDATPVRNSTKTSYFRRKALGLPTEAEQSAPPARKRGYSEFSAESPSLNSPVSSPASATNPREVTPTTDMAVTKLQKTNTDDDALFARIRAARESLAQGQAFYHEEVAKVRSPTSHELDKAAYSTPSLERARIEARERRARNNGVDIPAYRLRESRFVPRDSYIDAVKAAQSLREERALSNSRPVSRTSHHSQADPLINGTSNTSTMQQEPTHTDGDDVVVQAAGSTVPAIQADVSQPVLSNGAKVSDHSSSSAFINNTLTSPQPTPAVFSNNTHTLDHSMPPAPANSSHRPRQPSPTRNSMHVAQSTQPTTSFGTFGSSSQSQAQFHPTIGQDYTIPSTQIPASLSASFESSFMDNDHTQASHQHEPTSQASALPPLSHIHDHEDSNTAQTGNHVAHNGHYSNGYGHSNRFALLQEGNDEDEVEEDTEESEQEEDEAVDYEYPHNTTSQNLQDGVMDYDSPEAAYDDADDEDEVEGGYGDAEDEDASEAEDGNTEDDNEEESDDVEGEDYDEDDDEDEDQARNAYFIRKMPREPTPNEALQAIGNNETDAIELSD